MNDKEWIGIQFNLDKSMELKTWLHKYKDQGIETDGEHVKVEFGKNELKKLESDNSIKLDLMKSAIKKCLKRSDYTNIYTYLNAESVSKYKLSLLKGEFNKPIRINEFSDKVSIIGNLESRLESTQILKILRKDKLMVAMGNIFNFVVSRNFEREQRLTLEINYEDKEEWGGERDNLNVSIQLETEE